MSSLILAPLVLALAGPSGGAAPAAGPVGTVAAPAAALQTFSAMDLEGRPWTARHLRGRVVLIDFWATWCAPCLAELPRLKSLHAKYSRDEFEILGVSLDVTSRRSLISWLNRNRIDWPQVHDRAGYSGEIARLFGIDRLPRTILLDRDGSIVALDARGDRLAALIDQVVRASSGASSTRGPGR